MSFSNTRYERPDGWFRRCGTSGLQLSAVSLGAWHNFGAPGTDSLHHAAERAVMDNCREMLRTAFDCGITHFDLANNYGPPPGSAEERVGEILKLDFGDHRDELVISSKAGYRMWPGPYGDGGSRKYLVNSCDQSLKRLQLDYLDIFYHHRVDPETPLEETLEALDHLVRTGRVLYVGISNYYDPCLAHRVVELCNQHGWTQPIIHQFCHHMFDQDSKQALLRTHGDDGLGTIIFSPLAGGLLTNKYLKDIPDDSRAANEHSPFMNADRVTPLVRRQLQDLHALAGDRGQSMAQLALAWVLRYPQSTSALIGTSRPSQVKDCAAVLEAGPLTGDELKRIEQIMALTELA